MLEMYMRKSNGWWLIRVHGYPTRRYLYYTKREAVKKYRQEFRLVGKHMVQYEMETVWDVWEWR